MLFMVGSTPRLVVQHPPVWREVLAGENTLQTFLASCAIMIYSFCCHMNMFASSFAMNDPTPRRVNKILARSVVAEFAVYVMVGLCGMLSFGAATGECVMD